MWDELKNAREGKGLSLIALSDKTGIAPGSIASWENVMPAAYEKLIKLSDALDVPPSSLLGYETKEGVSLSSDLREGCVVIRSKLNEGDLLFLECLLEERDREMRGSLLKGEISQSVVDMINSQYSVLQKIRDMRKEAK